MSNTQAKAVDQIQSQIESFDLVVVGGGYAGLNALFAAVQYLPRGSTVLLLDKRDGVGGMWNSVYDYVRLHQAHSVFTVGDMKWNWNKSPGYRATGDEVLAHLSSAVGPISKRVALESRFNHTVISCEEVATGGGHRAEVIFHANDNPQQTRKVLATRAIYATGHDNVAPSPLSLSSKAVTSIAPQDLTATLADQPDTPVYVVGGGKTGMDTVNIVLAKYPNREVVLLKGSGTNFINRDQVLPEGFVNRWTTGNPISTVIRDLAVTFDGDNGADVIEHFRRLYSTDPESTNQNMQFGFQSEEEHRTVKNGVKQTLQTHLEDVIDSPSGPLLQLRDGTSQPVPEGSIFVNCTGSFFLSDTYQKMTKCLSPNDTVLTINLRDGYMILSGVSAWFLTHLLYRDKLRGRGFYTLDHEAAFRQCRKTWMGAAAAQAYQNQCVALQSLPLMLLNKCGLDMDRWYPLPRRLVNVFKMRNFSSAEVKHCRKVLDQVGNRLDLHCAPIE